ncbi:MAG: 2Fe-2S iron-sulfur cluster binding domain-containing protein [Alphaproteobacteria bacterium]|nr:2Fe-2S iron-sulfur cluster binding domain-containing protein [Alphaproteobacteria bacterium]MBF0375523.1 2Fe-2S iron-sulfur cluster binding domain-containing protein [Alphaproteobacteria bacterium]
MTTLSLFALILLGIVLQVGVAALVAFRKHWLAYEELLDRASDVPARPAVAVTPPAWTGYRPFRVIAKTIEDAAGSVCSFRLAPADGGAVPSFLPGQFLTFRLSVAGSDRPIVRCYSLSDRPGMDTLRVSIKRVASGLSSNHFHDHVREGDILDVKAPSGHFHLDPRGDGPVVLIAGGIGVTPLLSMAAACLHENPDREIWFFHGVRDGRERIMGGVLAEWAERHPRFHPHLSHSRPDADAVEGRDFHHRGHVDIRLLRLSLPLKPFDFHICGPRAMLESLVPALLDWGVPSARIHYEAFGPASLPNLESGPVPGDPFTVTFARSRRTVTWTPGAGSLLEVAEANGIPVESGCRAGGCGMCQTRLESGQVTYDQSPDFDPEPGTCLLCLGRPKSNLVLSA